MRHKTTLVSFVAATLMATAACNRPEPTPPAATEASREQEAAAELQKKRADDTAELDRRVSELSQKWTEMEAKLVTKTASATTALRGEVKEDMANVREAVDDLRTTTNANWWERHERALERTADDIETDVRGLTKTKPAATPAAAAASPVEAAPFASRRDQFVSRMRTRVERMEEQLKTVRAGGARETELDDTRARVEKLSEDLDRLGKADADDWWDVSVARVREYIDRLDASVRRLDDNRT